MLKFGGSKMINNVSSEQSDRYWKGLAGDESLKFNEKMILHCLIVKFDVKKGYAEFSDEELFKLLREIKVTTLNKTIKKLEDRGYLEVERLSNNKALYSIKKYIY